MNNIFILIPAYNVSPYLEAVIAKIPKRIIGQKPRIVIIDDKSTDSTLAVAKNLAKRFLNIEVIEKRRHEGYAMAQKTGIRYALKHKADVVVILHGDGQYAPKELPQLAGPIVKGTADVVLGSRILGGEARRRMPLVRYCANRILTTIENWAFDLHFAEYHSGYMAYSRQALETIPFMMMRDSFHFDGEMLMVGAKLGLRVKEVPISTHFEGQKSNLNPFRYLLDIAAIIYKYIRGGYGFS